MKKLCTTALVAASLLFAGNAFAQTNFQTFYDLGRNHFTTTMEGFHQDNWGNTFFFIDYDYNIRNANNTVIAPSGTYMEIARCLNFWQDSSLSALSVQVEYNGGLGIFGVPAAIGGFTVNSAFLVGLDYFLHSENFNNTLNLKVLYKKFVDLPSNVPFQFTTVWGCQDLFGVKGLRFSGFADFWCEYNNLVFLSEPQLWFQVFDHFNIGSEVEFSYNFAGMQGFNVMPCIGTKWVF